ncbi:putative 2-dehydropantoate 2-reductase [Photobacterium sp. DNB23_23_1]|uniref:2-dehydropantoate 2-reductase n=1 Tax=Photobacterium pectinilyticum TaxID=2906793 RepID=A0ABT1MWH5_9GAMM|nr:putative 2-dehydropantoate 2-reductase [Photobacterium sp. ZSDE20]MCQ1056838.1 putative 2-dehydropantoate 2-reductase [Photobacterium sp. ZSDE20]MDD1820973.1 putative 2-dehydropantoate 2-reductase [Photobacterium sp. ZSDE20]
MDQKIYAVIGTGAIGGYYGARLHHGGHDVHFLLNSDYQFVRQHGLKVDSHYGDYSIPADAIKAYNASEEMPKADVVIVALKTTQNHQLETLIRPLLTPNTLVLLLQNGIGGEQALTRLLNIEYTAGGLCFICSNKVGPGHIHHIDYGRLTLGVYGELGMPALTSVANDFHNCGVEVDVENSILDARWKKLLWNVPYNGLSAVLDTDTAQIMACGETVSLVKAIMKEVCIAAKATGSTLDSSLIDIMLNNTAQMKPYLTSMLLDRRNGREMELQYMYKNVLDMAAEQGVDMPRTEALYQQLSFVNRSVANE